MMCVCAGKSSRRRIIEKVAEARWCLWRSLRQRKPTLTRGDPGQGSQSRYQDPEGCEAVEEYQSESGNDDAQGALAGDAPAAVSRILLRSKTRR